MEDGAYIRAMNEVTPFDWARIWLGANEPPLFLLEIAFRSIVMYGLILGALRITGKRGVKQLSLFELTIILGLGSAAGDPMFYSDVPMLHALVVFVVVVLMYVFFNKLTERSEYFEELLEGKTVCVIENGVINRKTLRSENLTYAELFGEMRQKQVEHLGQVKKVYLESTGEISVFFFTDEEVRPGLPIFPEILQQGQKKILTEGDYACQCCGMVQHLSAASVHICANCAGELWLKPCTTKRLA